MSILERMVSGGGCEVGGGCLCLGCCVSSLELRHAMFNAMKGPAVITIIL